jgi:HD superfamily phosphodiesterase
MSTIAGIRIPDSQLAREATDLVRDTETDLLFHHSRRVFLFGALTGASKGLAYDPELLYIGAMFHDMGLMKPYSSQSERFEVDGAKVVTAHPRGEQFEQDIIEAFYQGIKHKPETTFGNVKTDVLELKDPHFHRGNFCEVILNSAWPS